MRKYFHGNITNNDNEILYMDELQELQRNDYRFS